jgi:hypothetical protein
VPFFLQPRSAATRCAATRHSASATATACCSPANRWAAGPFVDMAVFVDAGTVATPVRRARPGPPAHVTASASRSTPRARPRSAWKWRAPEKPRAGVLLQPPFLTLAFEFRGSRS